MFTTQVTWGAVTRLIRYCTCANRQETKKKKLGVDEQFVDSTSVCLSLLCLSFSSLSVSSLSVCLQSIVLYKGELYSLQVLVGSSSLLIALQCLTPSHHNVVNLLNITLTLNPNPNQRY